MPPTKKIEGPFSVGGYVTNERSLYEVQHIGTAGVSLLNSTTEDTRLWTFEELVEFREVLPEIPDSPDSLM